MFRVGSASRFYCMREPINTCLIYTRLFFSFFYLSLVSVYIFVVVKFSCGGGGNYALFNVGFNLFMNCFFYLE